MMVSRIVSLKSLFRQKAHNDISRVQIDWLAFSQQASEQNVVQMTEKKKGYDSRSQQNKTTHDKWQK